MRYFLLVSSLICTLGIPAMGQMCGMSFVSVAVHDKDKKPVAGSTIELLGKLTEEQYKPLAAEFRAADSYGPFGIPAKNALGLIDLLTKLPDADDVGNPLKQNAGVTAVKRTRDGEASLDNFGFALREGHSFGRVLVKLSAVGFDPSYFVSTRFYGCNEFERFILNK